MPDGVNIPGGPSFAGTPQPPDVPCDPTGEAWRGEPGPMGPPGPQGIPGQPIAGGPFLPLSGGTVTGAPGVTATSGFFGGIANPGMRAGGAALTWVGKSDNGQMQYYDELSASAFYAQPGTGLAVVSAVRSSDVAPGYAAIGFATFVTSDTAATNAASTWGLYSSNRRLPGGAQTIGAELTMGNLAPTAEVNAYYMEPGITPGLWLSSGSEAHTAGETLYPASLALGIVSNGSSWAKGIVILQNAIKQNAAGTYTAIQFPAGHEMQWIVDGVNTRGAFIRSDATTGTNTTGILFNNTGFHVVDAAIEANRFSVSATGAISASALSIGTIYQTSGAIYAGAAAGRSDLTKHIDLSGAGTYGFNYWGNAINLNMATGGSFVFQINNGIIGLIDATGLNYLSIGGTGAAAGAFTTLSASSGMSFGATAVTGVDLSKHIALYSTVMGFNVTGGRLNYVVSTGNIHAFVVNAVDRLTISSTGLGFNGTAAVAKPTVSGAKGSNAALASLMTALAAYGLVTDSTTA
jgi:hypothetical protein